MSHLFVKYGEDRWAIWSTVVDDFIVYDATAKEVIEYEAERAYDRQEDRSRRKVQSIKKGKDVYPLWRGPPEEKIEELKDE